MTKSESADVKKRSDMVLDPPIGRPSTRRFKTEERRSVCGL
jgi:hypothetical protein